MRFRSIAAAAFGLLAAAFAVDVLTPQTLVIAILLDVPIVLAALTQSRRLTAWVVSAALFADAAAAFVNAARDGFRWEPIGVGDRLLSMLSIVLVGYLSIAVQERASKLGRLAAQEARARREATLSAASDRIRTSLSHDVVTRAIVAEAVTAHDAQAAFWYPARAGEEVLTARADGDVHVLAYRPAPEIASLTHRVAENRAVAVVLPSDPVGGLVLDRLRAPSAVAIPVAERGADYGVLIVIPRTAVPDDAVISTGRAFAVIAANALAKARLFGELAERNAALSQRQDVIRDLVFAISHDLRTPLTALSMTLRQAADGAYGTLPDRYAAVLRDSRVSIDDLMRLAETLLLVARFESGERRVERDVVDLDAVAAEVASELEAMAQSRGVAVHVAAGTDARTRGSRGDLKRALTNLVANALQHTPAGGTVDVAIAAEGDAVAATVSDDGFGVDERMRAQMFQRFSAGSRSGGGTGLGLYIVRRIVEEAGGSVRYAPREPRGSVFVLSLPRASA